MSQAPTRGGPDRQVRYGRMLGLLFVAAGFAAIGFGWNGAAKTAFPDKQFPYLVSGGVGGLGLIVLGGALLLIAQSRAERIRLTEQLDHLAAALSRTSAASSESGPPADGLVVAGRSTYHRPDCRLVQGKPNLEYLTVEAAKGTGLSPCRVCDPETKDRAPSPPGASRSRPRRRGASRAGRS
jgi:hypothetical protein